MTRPVLWSPHPRQRAFLARGEFECLYGGAAGGGKSDALIVDAVRMAHKGNYRALLLRRTFPELEKTHIDRAELEAPTLSAKCRKTDREVDFPNG